MLYQSGLGYYGRAVVSMKSPVRIVLRASVSPRVQRALAAESEVTAMDPDSHPQESFAVARELAPCILIMPADALTALNLEAVTMALSRPGVRIVVIDKTADETKMKQYIRTGYCGVLHGTENLRFIKKAVRAVAGGEIWAGRRLLSELLWDFARANNPRKLTTRETEILDLITQGHNNREIAEKLFVTRETIRWHVRSLYSKLGVLDRTTLMRRQKKAVKTE